MIQERGIVTKVEGKIAFIRMPQNKKCENCSGKGSCMVLDHADEVMIKVNNTLDAHPGDEISLIIGHQSSEAHRLLLFFIAIFTLLVGGAAGRFCSRFIGKAIGQLLPVTFGLGTMVISVMLWLNYEKQRKQRQPRPIMEKIINRRSQDNHGNQVNLQQ